MKNHFYNLAIKHIILGLIALIVFSCKKDDNCITKFYDTSLMDLEWQKVECLGSFPDSLSFDFNTIQLGNQFLSPAFNPKKPYEFCYYQVIADSGSQFELDNQIVVFNLKTGVKTVILNNVEVIGNLAWNQNDWIAYKNPADGIIYAVQKHTKEIVQLSEYSNVFSLDDNIAWLHNSDTLIWGGSDINNQSFIKKRSISEINENTIVYGGSAAIFREFTISKNNFILARISSDLHTGINFSITEINNILNTWGYFNIPIFGNNIGRVNWNEDSKRFYVPMLGVSDYESAGLYEINYESKAIKKLYDFCDKQFIYQAVCSPNGRYLIIQKILRDYIINSSGDPISSNTIIENTGLWLYDLETGKEARLPLD